MQLEQTFTSTFPRLATPAQPTVPAGVRLAWVNEPLAAQLGLDATWLSGAKGLAWMTGARSDTYALAYSGYQFGQLSPVLGDGRAHLIGELTGQGAGRVDLHLKGSGLTPFSRRGSDGKAPLAACWREAVIGEALHGLGVPTSRALAVFETGETLARRGPEPGGMALRVADSHLRVGTFQYAQMGMDTSGRQDLVDYALGRHPVFGLEPDELTPAERTEKLLSAVAARQVDLIAQWQGLGFVHGVLNTDNVTISGQAIDFGPCAFIDVFKRGAVYSSIDHAGRYAYVNQFPVTRWNLARFAESIIDLLGGEPHLAIDVANDVLGSLEETYRQQHTNVFARKLGIDLEASPQLLGATADFVDQTLDLLEAEERDFTGFFRALTDSTLAGGGAPRLGAWLLGLENLRAASGTSAEHAVQLMQGANPVYIPRNLHLDAALQAAVTGDTAPVLELFEAVLQPYERKTHLVHLETAPPSTGNFVTYCGT
ncbi:MAG: protein adenylyltransferase SelO family protein [Rothia sp. (in: high G+C Gram-positive bacteria)]|nr:protein adenylyltransferase SelO family protein [Rothia sp. (in: high G+C Gram-positive bacteria)]